MSFERKLVRLLQWGVYAALATPLVYTGFTIYPFIFGKTVFFRLVIEALIIPYGILLLRAPQYRPKRSPLQVAVLAYLGIMFIAALLGVDFWRSFWSNHERMMGIFTLGHVVVLFFVSQSVFRSRVDGQRLLGVSIGIAAVVSGIGIMQYFRPILFANPGGRIWSTLGNYIYLASYALFHFFFAAILFVQERSWKRRALWGAAAALFLLTFVMTQTRGAFVALFAGLIFLAFAAAFTARTTRIRLAAAACLLAVLATGASLWLARDTPFVRGNSQLSRLASISVASGSARLLNWRIAATALLARPLLGWGPENYYFAFNRFYDPQMYAYSSYESWQDHAHHIILDVGNESGLIGLLAYFGMFAAAGAMLWGAMRRGHIDRGASLLIATLLVVYFLQNLFVFDVLATWILFYIVLAFIVSETRQELPKVASVSAPLTLPQSVVIMGGIVAVAITAYVANISPLIVTATTVVAGRNYNQDFSGSMVKMEQALERSSPYKAESREEYGKLVMLALQTPGFPREAAVKYLQRALSEFQKTVREHPRDAYARLTLAQWHFVAGNFLDAETELLQALSLSPARQQIYYALIRFYLIQNNFPRAVEFAKRMVDLAPNIQVSHWYYGEALARAGEKEGGYQEMLGALRGNFGPQGLVWAIPEMEYFVSLARETGATLEADWYEAILLLRKGDRAGALTIMERVFEAGYRLEDADVGLLRDHLTREPETPDVRLFLIKAYVRNGNIAHAQIEAAFLRKHSPNYAVKIDALFAGIQ